MAQISLFAMHVANLLGFKRIADVRGVTSVTRLFENGMSPCGLYLQIRPQGELYIGQTANLPARFERHLARGTVITELAFMPAHPKTLDEKEKALIAKAERLGLELNNLALRSKHESLRPAFSEIYPEDWVKCWLNPETPPANPFRERYEAIHSGLRHQLDLAMAHPTWPQALPAARQAIRWLIPKPEQSAGIFWSADAYTKRLDEPFLPLIRIHLASYTLLEIGLWQDAPRLAWARLQVLSNHEIEERYSLQETLAKLPYVRIESLDKGYILSTAAALLPALCEMQHRLLRQSVFPLLKEPLLKRGNPALEYLLIR